MTLLFSLSMVVWKPAQVIAATCLPSLYLLQESGPHFLLVLALCSLCVHLVVLVEVDGIRPSVETAEHHAGHMCGKAREGRTCHLFLLGSEP